MHPWHEFPISSLSRRRPSPTDWPLPGGMRNHVTVAKVIGHDQAGKLPTFFFFRSRYIDSRMGKETVKRDALEKH